MLFGLVVSFEGERGWLQIDAVVFRFFILIFSFAKLCGFFFFEAVCPTTKLFV